MLAVALFALAGFLLGGAYAFKAQGRPTPLVVVLGVGGVLALAAGALRL
jgi:hypothetical protein